MCKKIINYLQMWEMAKMQYSSQLNFDANQRWSWRDRFSTTSNLDNMWPHNAKEMVFYASIDASHCAKAIQPNSKKWYINMIVYWSSFSLFLALILFCTGSRHTNDVCCSNVWLSLWFRSVTVQNYKPLPNPPVNAIFSLIVFLPVVFGWFLHF